MSFSLTEVRFVDAVEVTDYVANGSFASLKANVTYRAEPDFAVLARLVDHNAGWKGDRVYVSEKAYKFLSKSSLVSGDVVIANVGANAGTVFQIPNLGIPVTLGPNAVRVRPKGPDLDRDFLYYYLSSPLGQDKLQSIITGSAQPKFNKTALRGLAIRLPSVGYQRQTVELVKALDDRIALLRETNATLEATAQAIFKSWFVDFDPVRAKQEGRAPEGMDEATAALFPDSFAESELGLLPRGWRVGTLGALALLHKGTINPLNQPDILFEHFSLPAFDNGQIPVAEAGVEIKSNKTPVPTNAVLISKLNPHIPRVWMPTDVGQHAVCSTEFLVFVPAGGASKYFNYCSFLAPQFRQSLCQLVTGTSNSHQRVKPDGILSMPAIVPTGDVLASFGAVSGPMFDRIGHNRKQTQTLATLRDTLLPRLISGQLRLPDAEDAITEAVA